MSELDKMVEGEAYDPTDAYLVAARTRARELLKRFNDSHPAESEQRAILVFGEAEVRV